MTDQKDIIGIVKELQEEYDSLINGWECEHGFCLDKCQNDPCLGRERLRIHKSLNATPRIVLGLLLAVEALEKYAVGSPVVETHDGSGSPFREDLAVPAREALSRIRSLLSA